MPWQPPGPLFVRTIRRSPVCWAGSWLLASAGCLLNTGCQARAPEPYDQKVDDDTWSMMVACDYRLAPDTCASMPHRLDDDAARVRTRAFIRTPVWRARVVLAVCGGIGEEKGGRRSLHLLPLLYCCSRLSRTEPEGGHPSTHPAPQVNLLSAVFSSQSTFALARQTR